MKLIFTMYLLAVSWKDLKNRQIPVWLYCIFGLVGILACSLQGGMTWGVTWMRVPAAMIPGLLLLAATKCSRGAIGSGDGCFFITAAFYMDFWHISGLLCYGLTFCSACCLGMVVWGCISGVNVRKIRLPFLPFLVPAWIWINILVD